MGAMLGFQTFVGSSFFSEPLPRSLYCVVYAVCFAAATAALLTLSFSFKLVHLPLPFHYVKSATTMRTRWVSRHGLLYTSTRTKHAPARITYDCRCAVCY